MPFAEIVFNLPLDHSYTYHIPQDMQNIKPGMRAFVPFGKRTITGVIVSIIQKTHLSSTRDIIDLPDDKPLLSPKMLALTKWLAAYYLSSWGQAIYLALPKGINTEDKERLHLVVEDPDVKLTERQKDLYLIIGEQPGNTKEFYRKKFGDQSFHYFVSALEKKGLIRREKYRQTAKVRTLSRKFVQVSGKYESIKQNHDKYVSYIKRRPEIDLFFKEHTGKELLLSDFLKHTSMASATLQKMVGYELCTLVDKTVERRPENAFHEADKVFDLTEEQKQVLRSLHKQVQKESFSVFLLHGVTGSGKTQVYIETLKKILEQGKNGIVLIPEIALTPQTAARFMEVSQGKTAVFHSKMSAGERLDAWNACYEGRVRVVIGPRSALFAPLQNIGLIIVDEEHETTYKQTDTSPRYSARDTAIVWAKMHNAIVVLGSATPSLDSYYNARRKKYTLLEIRNRVENIKMPFVHIVDMKRNRARIGSTVTLFSQILAEKIADRLSRKEQIILLQNRRGYSSFMQCVECGYIPLCANCDISLTYHSHSEEMKCHLCGHRQPAYHQCPACGGKQIDYKGMGTQRIQDDLLKLFEGVRILRMDQDTTRGKNRHGAILQAFGAGKADILLGTQMIAKGLDFENVTLAGVISADVGLAIPDFRSAERVFQLLTQVAGRSGRGKKGGEVVVQSYLPRHHSIQAAEQHDFIGFYMQEMQHRRDYKYPPFYKLIQIVVSAVKMSDAIALTRKLAVSIQRRVKNHCQVVGPAPGIIPRINNLFRWQLTLRIDYKTDPTGQKTRLILKQILEPYLSKRNQEIRVSVDIDPLLLS